MVRKAILLMSAVTCLSGVATAQTTLRCFADEVHAQLRQHNPDVAKYEEQLQREIQEKLSQLDLRRFAKSTADEEVYHIPIVFHIIHDYGNEYIPDDTIFNELVRINRMFNRGNADTADVIPQFRGNVSIPRMIETGPDSGTVVIDKVPYIGKGNIQFHLATKDPNGNPTRGITRRRSYLATNASDQAKFDQWPPDSYLNIWIINSFSAASASAAAYALKPAGAASIPYYDGVISRYDYVHRDNTLTHEIGHTLNLDHTWGGTNNPEVACGDDDVEDTPPTEGHMGNGCAPSDIYDTTCIYTKMHMGRLTLTDTAAVGDRTTDVGITFNTPTRIYIDSVDIYPSDTIGSPFTIELKRNATVIASYSGNTTVSNGRQRVPVFFTVPAGKNYRLVFAENPLALRDTPTIQHVDEVPGAMRITSGVDGENQWGYFYNIVMRYGYFKVTPWRDAEGDAYVIDYPDTTNAQNVMDYTYCSKMFTRGQVERMRAALNSSVAGRNRLISAANLEATGALAPLPDLPPVADFSVNKLGGVGGTDKVYGCANGTTRFGFTDRSWNDTIIARSWTFSNGANPATSTQAVINTTAGISFTQPGWVTVSLTATGNNSGSTTVTRTPIYVADPTPKNAFGYYQEFNPDGDVDKWPIFNYYDNYFQWSLYEGTGYYDKYSIYYRNYDKRTTIPSILTGTPRGDYDDFFTPLFDLSGPEFAANCNLNFMSAGAFRTSNPAEMTDSLIIHYSVNCGDTWFPLKTLTKADIGNNGTLNYEFFPEWMGAWKLQSIPVPENVRNASNGVMFRFRFRPGAFANNLGSGNNFFIDRIHVSQFPTGVNDDVIQRQGMVLTPNPTHGGAHLIVNGGSGLAQVQVTDVTGKVVYRVAQQLTNGLTKIEIPASAVAAKGMYMVQLVSGNNTMTEKLVVY